MTTRFIAETDADGTVLWVWRFGQDDRIAKPVGAVRLCPEDLECASFHGASESAIRTWVTRLDQPSSKNQS